jgi:plastocyanin
MDTIHRYRRHAWATAGALAIIAALAGCGSSATGNSASGTTDAGAGAGQPAASATSGGMTDDTPCDKPLEVVFTEKAAKGQPDKYFFSPKAATVKKGEYISFRNRTDEVHALVATPDAGLAESTIDKGESQPVQFNQAGTFTLESRNAKHRGSMKVTVLDEPGTTCGMKPPTATVNITEKAGPPDHYSFTPPTTTIKAGDSLAVVNKTDENHTLSCTPDPGINDSNLRVDKTESQVLTFATAGTYECSSTEHTDAKITVAVQ